MKEILLLDLENWFTKQRGLDIKVFFGKSSSFIYLFIT